MTTRTFSQEELTAFLDSEAPDDLRLDIERAVAQDAELANRLAALTIPLPQLRSEFDAVLSNAPAPPELPRAALEVKKSSNWRGLFPGLALGLAAGLAVAVMLPQDQPKEPGWLEVVANYQMLYTPETIAPINESEIRTVADFEDRLAHLSDVIDLDLNALVNIEGLTFRRAQQLGFNGKDIIQLVYALPNGQPVALCILRSSAPANDPRQQELQGMASSDWKTGTHGVLLIGGDDQSLIDTLTPKFQELV